MTKRPSPPRAVAMNPCMIIGALCNALLSGCQAIAYGTAADFNQLQTGMGREGVEQRLGSPLSTEANAERREERLIYKRMSSVSSWAPTYYDVLLRDGKVVEFGERR